MLDIIPSGPSGKKKKTGTKGPTANVVELSWKLPARLRRPVGDDFKRHRITTVKPGGGKGQMGVEHHTGDIYRNTRAEVRLPEPPYAGGFSKSGFSSSEWRRRKLEAKVAKPVRDPFRSADKHRQAGGERDIPYNFEEQVMLPANRISRKKKPGLQAMLRGNFGFGRLSFNVGVLLMGCVLLYGVFWSLQGLGNGLVRLGPVRELAGQALENVMAASGALAETDFSEGEQKFADAEALLHEARVEMDKALDSSQTILKYVDVTGTYRSGEEVLVAGEELTRAGQYVSRGLELLLTGLPAGQAGLEQRSLVAAVGQSQQEFVQAVEALEKAEQSLEKVNSPFLPKDVAEQVDLLRSSVPRIKEALSYFLDQSGVLLTMLGAEREREYLLLFMNNHELRPTGGFVGSIALVSVDRGVVEEVDVHSVYDGDGQLKEFIAPPEPLSLVTNRWYLRDTNWFVDWPVSAAKAVEFFEKEGGPTVDGVIAMTPEVVRGMLGVVGEIEMPQYGVTVTVDNFWEVVQREVTYEYDKSENKPKQFLADLTPILLGRLMAAPSDQSLAVLNVLSKMVEEKNMLLYFREQNVQQRLAEAGWSGAVPRDRLGLLAVNNANIGGHKSDQFMEQEIDYRLDVQKDGDVDVMVTIRRTHRGPEEALGLEYPKDENPAEKDNVVYQRVLVPKGAVLKEAEGFTSWDALPRLVVPEPDIDLKVDPEVAEWQRGQVQHESGTTIGQEADYTFFANWIVTKPGQTTVALYHYLLPAHARMPDIFDPAESFEAFVVKQPGQERCQVRVEISLPEETRVVHTEPAEGLTQHSANEIVYRGMLQSDVLVGAVYEKSK